MGPTEHTSASNSSSGKDSSVGGYVHHTASHSWASHQGTNVECRIYERGGVHVMPVWVDHFYFEPWAGGDAVSPLVLGNDDDQAGDEENVEMAESPEGEESDAQLTRGE